MYYSYNNGYPIDQNQIPDRIRLADGFTRTDRSTFTEEELESAGYKLVSDPPDTTGNQKLFWNGIDWEVHEYTEQELAQRLERLWSDIRKTRDNLLNQLDWRFTRYQSQIRLGLEPSDRIEDLDRYAQELRDITQQSDPTNINWPINPFNQNITTGSSAQ